MSDDQPPTQDPDPAQPGGSAPDGEEPAKKHGDPLLQEAQGERSEGTGTATSATA